MAEPQEAASPSAATEDAVTKPRVDTSAADSNDLQPGSAYATPLEERPEAIIAAAMTPSQPSQSTQPQPLSALEKSPSDSTPSRPAAVSQPTAASIASGTEPIGPSITAVTNTSTSEPIAAAGPTLHITILLTTGDKHPFKIDQKYLRKRGVTVQGDDPFNMSVYMLKELILREWRKDWDSPPTSPAYIRLINMGRMLDDKVPLKDCRFNHDSTNIVHMTVKPQELFNDDEENAKSGKLGRYRDDGEGATAGCKCVIL